MTATPCPECGAPTGAPCNANCPSRRLTPRAFAELELALAEARRAIRGAIPHPQMPEIVTAAGAIATVVGLTFALLAPTPEATLGWAGLEVGGILATIIGLTGMIDGDPTLERDEPEPEPLDTWHGFPVHRTRSLDPGEIRIEPNGPRERRPR